MTDAELAVLRLCREELRAWLDRDVPVSCGGCLAFRQDQTTRNSHPASAHVAWRDFEREPCVCESRGFVVVAVVGGFRMERCARCNANGLQTSKVAPGTTNDENSDHDR